MLSTLSALTLVFAPTLPAWTEPHTPHINRPPLTLQSGQVLTQTFTFEYPTLDRVAVWLDVAEQPLPTTGTLELTVNAQQATRSFSVPWTAVAPSGLLVAPIDPPFPGGFGQTGTITVQLSQPNQTVAVAYQADPSKYGDGALSVPGTKYKGDVAFQLRYQRAALGQWRWHVLYGLAIVLAGGVLAWWLFRPTSRPTMANQWLTTNDVIWAITCGLFAVVFYGAYLVHQGFWVGSSDFSKDAMYLQPAAQALLAGQWPVWSHLTCGGMALLGNPEGNTFSLGTIFATFLPADQAFLLLLVLEAGIAATGTYLLARALRLGVWGSLIATIIAILSPTYAYRIVEGLTPIGGTVAFLPWILLGFIRAITPHNPSAKWWAVLSGLGLGAVLLRGEVHVITGIIVTLLLWAIVTAIRQRQLQPLVVGMMIGLTMFLVSSIKILPYLEQPDLLDHSAIKPYVAILSRENQFQKVFLRLQDRTHRIEVLHGDSEGFGNFGAYLGVLPFVLAGLGLWTKKPYRWELLITTLGIFILTEGTIFDLYIRHIPGLDALMRVPTRFLSIFVLLLGLLAGRGLEWLTAIARPGWRYLPPVAISAALFFDLGLATHTVFRQNLTWNHDPIMLYPDQPTLMPHQNDSPQQMYHPTKLARAGFLLPQICADQNNPPIFIKDLTEPTTVADVPVVLTPNQIHLTVSQQATAQELTVRERFVSSWISSEAELLPNDDGSIRVIIPSNASQQITLRYLSATATTQKVLFLIGLILVSFPLTRGGEIITASCF